MEQNIWVLFVAALIPMVVGFIWYHGKVFGTAWMHLVGKTEAELAKGNMVKILGLSYILSLILAFALSGLVIHQSGMNQLFAMDMMEGGNAENAAYFKDFISRYGDMHRSFGHGALHGALGAIFFALPYIGISAMFEHRPWKLIWIQVGYWVLTCTLMGGVLCAFM